MVSILFERTRNEKINFIILFMPVFYDLFISSISAIKLHIGSNCTFLQSYKPTYVHATINISIQIHIQTNSNKFLKHRKTQFIITYSYLLTHAHT